MPKRNRKNAAFKELLKAHKKGPKRLKLYTERRNDEDDEDHLLNPKKSKHIQLVINGYDTHYICVVVLPVPFKKMALTQGMTYTMPSTRLTRAGTCLYKTFGVLDHNDRVLQRVHHITLKTTAGKCLVVAGKFKLPDATLIITSKKRLVTLPGPVVAPKRVECEIEYM